MGSRHPPRPYDKATLAALEQAFSNAGPRSKLGILCATG